MSLRLRGGSVYADLWWPFYLLYIIGTWTYTNRAVRCCLFPLPPLSEPVKMKQQLVIELNPVLVWKRKRTSDILYNLHFKKKNPRRRHIVGVSPLVLVSLARLVFSHLR